MANYSENTPDSEGERPRSYFGIFTEREMNERIEVGKLYRPGYYSILIISDGTLSLKHNLSEFEIPKNSLVFILPSAAYEFSQISSDFRIAGIIYNREFLGQSGIHRNSSSILETFATGFQPYYTISEGEIQKLLSLFSLLEASMYGKEGMPFAEEIKKSTFLSLFYHALSIYRQYNAAQKVKLNRAQELSISFFQLLSEHFCEERSVQYYADLLFVTPKHLTQTLKETTGRTAGEFIDRAVLMEAKLLLRNPALNIGDVAGELHFSDQFAFAKFFKKHTGLTPSQFRSEN